MGQKRQALSRQLGQMVETQQMWVELTHEPLCGTSREYPSPPPICLPAPPASPSPLRSMLSASGILRPGLGEKERVGKSQVG